MKSNKEKNTQHAKDQILKVRPKQPAYDFEPLEAVIRQWITNSK